MGMMCGSCSHTFLKNRPELRILFYFRFDHDLLRKLPRLAWETVLEVFRAVLERILKHCGLWDRPASRAPPQASDPPVQPVLDLEYVNDDEFLMAL